MASVAAFAIVLGAASAGAQPVSGPGYDHLDYQLNSAQDLFDICTVEVANPDFQVAKAFCFGYFAGGEHYHAAVSAVSPMNPIACPTGGVTREQQVAVFVEFVRQHPDKAGNKPMDVVFESLATRWPCPGK